jgi:hypothetical protein
MSGRTALVIAACALTASACGSSPADAVRTTVQQFGQAVRSHDYRTLCTQVLAPSLVAHVTSNGISCERAMTIGLSSVRGAVLSIGKVTVHGSTAQVIALTVAANQQGSIDTIDLVHTPGGWRISALTAM